jgi:hypothetical protein
MRKILVSLAAAAVLLMSNTAVRADIINFGYSSDPNVNPTPPVGGDASMIYNSNNAIQTSSIKFTPANGAATYDGSAPSQFIIYNLTTKSTATAGPGSYDSFSNVPFNLGVTITDLASSAQQTLGFSGLYNADHVSSSSSHVDPASQGITWTTPLTMTKNIGGNDYTMKIISWTAPGAPGSPGSILSEVTVVPDAGGSGSPPPSGAPEPASLVLAGLALPALLAARRRMKKVEA